MNINPKKSWHVRSKTNIAKVNRDEAKAAAEETEKKRRVDLAASDERWSYLKRSAKERGIQSHEDLEEALDLFKDVKRGVDGVVAENNEHLVEKKQDQQKWERKVGLLKYLGEGSAEFSAEKPWWTQQRTSEKSEKAPSEREKQSKTREDPLASVYKSMKRTEKSEIPSKSVQSSSVESSSSSKSIEQLRRERLERERKEKDRTQQLLVKKGIIPMAKFPKSSPIDDERKRPYNSAFNTSISSHLRR